MKSVFKFFIILCLIICFGCDLFSDSNSSPVDSNCGNPIHKVICFTIIDDLTEEPIADARTTLYYEEGIGTGVFDERKFDSGYNGIGCFCLPFEEPIHHGNIKESGYEQMNLSGLITSYTYRVAPSH